MPRASYPSDWLQRALQHRVELDDVRAAARRCRACPLWERGTQTVFGEGAPSSRESRPAAMLVGEQPGDHEDQSGHPFVGPAGQLLDAALEAAGIERAHVYVTNAVKHFKWKPRGKRRIHEKPSVTEVRSCRPWLEAELALLEPHVVVCLGATAAQALLGPRFRVSRERGKLQRCALAPRVIATVHPSSLLRIPDARERRLERRRFVADLRRVAALLAETR